jgi:cytochrome c oxidase cbb3-type subunit II
MSNSSNSSLFSHRIFETNSFILLVGILIAVAIGGLVEIVPLFYLKNTIEKVDGVRPYSPLELAGFNIYVREGCYNCHSQMVRPLRDEVERYGHYSLAAESMYDHPFQWGSKRNGPDIARVGGKYSDDWHRAHLINPRSVAPASIMPGYPFLATAKLDYKHIDEDLVALSRVGVPYSKEQIEHAADDLRAQAGAKGAEDLAKRYPKAIVRDLNGGADITEADALVTYLQRLGTQVDFKSYDDAANIR